MFTLLTNIEILVQIIRMRKYRVGEIQTGVADKIELHRPIGHAVLSKKSDTLVHDPAWWFVVVEQVATLKINDFTINLGNFMWQMQLIFKNRLC